MHQYVLLYSLIKFNELSERLIIDHQYSIVCKTKSRSSWILRDFPNNVIWSIFCASFPYQTSDRRLSLIRLDLCL